MTHPSSTAVRPLFTTAVRYNGWDCTNLYGCVTAQKSRVAMGLWDNTTAVLPQGAEGSGPIAIMAADGSKTVVISAASSFMAQSQQFIPNDTPVVPPPPLSSFTADPDSYCNVGPHELWIVTPDHTIAS